MYMKGDEKGKKITANTIALKTRVPGEGTQESRHFFFHRKLLTGLASFYIL